ncbi:MAG: glycosyltransferase, partial [Pseudomonadota bacterium]
MHCWASFPAERTKTRSICSKAILMRAASMPDAAADEMQLKSGPIAYLTGEFPRATDTFIQREVAALREQGLDVVTCSIRRTATAHHVGPEQRHEATQTFHVLQAALSPLNAFKAHGRMLFSKTGNYFRALRLALTTSQPGLRGGLYQLVYFLEAIVLADFLRQRGVVHLHNHIAKSSCSVAMIASTASGIPFSFTLHGPDIFFEPQAWRLDAKIAAAKFVACISHFCRSQAMIFSEPESWSKLHIIHCGVELERYSAQWDSNVSADQRETSLRVLYVGRLASVKGLPVLFAALERIVAERKAGLTLTVIGDGPERARLEQDVVRRNLAEVVRFLGYQSQS